MSAHGIVTELVDHQVAGLDWMIQREQDQRLPGGLLLDEAGLGKTLMVLALIQAEAAGGPTLIVAPGSLVKVWLHEIEKHVVPGTCPTVMYYGRNRRLLQKENLHHYKVIMTSYGTVASEYEKATNTFETGSIFHRRFARVVIDEAHNIRNTTTNNSVAALQLSGIRRWALTATPIVNKLDDLYPLLQFLRLKPFCQSYAYWNNIIVKPFQWNSKSGVDKLHKYILPISIRRTKDVLQLPPIHEHNQSIELSQTERDFYNVLFEYSRVRVLRLMRRIDRWSMQRIPGDMRPRWARAHIMTMIMRMRQACCSPMMVINSMKRLAHYPKLRETHSAKAMVKLATEILRDLDLRDTDRGFPSECNMCRDNTPIYTYDRCGHMVCEDCYKKGHRRMPACVFCRTPYWTVHKDEMAANLSNVPPYSISRFLPLSSKLDWLDRFAKEHQGEKFVVVSQWTKMLDLAEAVLLKAGYNKRSICRLQGNTTPINRIRVVERFQTQPRLKVCLLSLTASSEGITLTEGKHLIHLDPWWNEARDYQVSNRIHRIGQDDPVHIHRLQAAETIEQNLEIMREKKTCIVSTAFGDIEPGEQMPWCNHVKLMFEMRKPLSA